VDKKVDAEVPTDKVFSQPLGDVTDFKFNKQVATVFDDMVSRSVPFYGEMQRMITEIAADYATPGSRIYDLGCATGTTLEVLDPVVDPRVEFVGIDNAEDMLQRCREKLEGAGMTRPLRLECADLNAGCAIENASVVLLILTLQFLRPLNREHLMKDLLRGMNDNGCLILVEKVLGEDSLFNRQFIKYYYDFKRRNGYSDLEITQKREALENVLIPYKLLENRELLLRTGFRYVDVFFKWYNFCGIVAVK
jgi:tRNA (cmo5U34)-methyltransferase